MVWNSDDFVREAIFKTGSWQEGGYVVQQYYHLQEGDTMFRKTTLIVTMLVTAAQIHPEIARSKLLRTDKMSRQKMPSQFAGSPSPRLRGLNLFACYISEKESARRRATYTAEVTVLDCGKGGIMRFCAETFKATKLR